MASEPPAPHLVFAHLWSAPLLEENSASKAAVDELDVIAERDTLEKILEEAPCAGWAWRSAVASETELQRMLSRANVLHFTGHGRQNGLLLEHAWDDDEYCDLGRARILTADKLQVLAGGPVRHPLDCNQESPEAPPRPLFAFLSACHSEHLGQAFVDCGVRHVVAIDGREPVLDTASKLFARVLYDALFRGSTVREAFSQARNRVQSEHGTSSSTSSSSNSPSSSLGSGSGSSSSSPSSSSSGSSSAPLQEHEKFLLLPRDRAPDYHNRPLGQHPSLLQSTTAAANGGGLAAPFGGGVRFVDDSPKRPTGFLQLPTGCFVGRAMDVCAVYRNLHHPAFRVCAVAGELGYGKTEVCLKALQHSQLRAEFSAYMSVSVKDVATQAIADATATAGSAAAAATAGATSSESSSSLPSDMAGPLARAILAAQVPHVDASVLGPTTGATGASSASSSVRQPASSDDLSALTAADAIALFVARQGRRAAVLYLDGAEHLWALHAAAIAAGTPFTVGGPYSGAGSCAGFEVACRTAAVVRELSQKCERLRILISVAHGSGNKDTPWPGLLEVPHEQINVAGLGMHDTARVFMKWARRGLLPKEYKHRALFEGPSSEFKHLMQSADLDAVGLFAMHPIIHRTQGHARTAVNAASLVTPIRTQGGRAEPELVNREAEFLAYVDACMKQNRDAGAAIVAALGLPYHNSNQGTPPPPSVPKTAAVGAAAAASAVVDGSPSGEIWSQFSWWHGNIDRETSKLLLKDLTAGHFLLRKSSRPGLWALDVNVMHNGSASGSSSSRASSCSSISSISSSGSGKNPGGDGSGGGGRSLPSSSATLRYLPLLVSRDAATGRMTLQRALNLDIPLGGGDYANIRDLVESNRAYLRFPVPRRR